MFEVGQKLWFVRSQKLSGEPREVTVEKTGRVWATLSNRLRCDASGRVDGGVHSSPGICYESREVYEAQVALRRDWYSFQSEVAAHRNVPPGMTTDLISQARKILNLTRL